MEPMTLGSPVNSPSSGGGNQSQYLPSFLMGDPQAMTPHNNTLSPKPGRYNVSFATSPTNNSPQQLDYSRSALGTRTLFGGASGNNAAGGSGANTSAYGAGGGGGPSSAQHHNTSHQAGPPTQGLFDSLRNEHSAVQTPPRQQPYNMSNMSALTSNYSMSQSYHPPTASLNDSYAPGSAAPNTMNASMRALCSPLGAHMSPMPHATMSMLQTPPHARGADFWVTIYGFAPGASSMVLQHFTLCGTIVDVVHAPQNGNWMHVRFSSRIESDKALNYNLKVIASNVMIGVTRCTDKSVVDKENSSLALNSDMELSKPKLRPIAQQSYKIAQQDSSISPTANVPQKSSGLMNKAMDLIFGW